MRHAIVRYGVVGIICVAVLASFASAATKTFVLKNGTRITGEVISESDEGYVVKTRLGKVSVPRYNVEEIIEVLLPEEEFAGKLEALADDDLAGHLELGRWALGKGLLDHAQAQCEFILAAEAEHNGAAMLQQQIEAVKEAAAARAEQKATAEARAQEIAAQQAAENDGGGIDPDSLITMVDIYRIRLAESRSTYASGDRRVMQKIRVNFKGGVLERLASDWEGRDDFDARAFLRKWSDGELLAYVDQNVDRDDWDTRRNIEITSEVLFMKEFHDFVFPLLRRGMAGVPAHASKEMHGGFRLLISPSRVPTDEVTLRVNYSNFILLDTFETKDGQRMIDRDRPEESLLLQYGLPSDLAKFKHGDVGGTPITPVFRGRDDPDYKRLLAWINMLRGPVHPLYNINYKPLMTTARPAPEPTPEPVEDEPEDADEAEDAEEADETLEVPASEETEP